jgi:translation initiation factor 2 subunit 2
MDYDDQLERALSETPDIDADGDRFDVPEPEVRQEGKRTVYENFQSTVDRLNRDEDHVMQFLQTELGTSGHIDERGRARLKGEFRASRIEEAIEDYVEGFVTCSECGLPDTVFERENGARWLRCEACGARSATGN